MVPFVPHWEACIECEHISSVKGLNILFRVSQDTLIHRARPKMSHTTFASAASRACLCATLEPLVSSVPSTSNVTNILFSGLAGILPLAEYN